MNSKQQHHDRRSTGTARRAGQLCAGAALAIGTAFGTGAWAQQAGADAPAPGAQDAQRGMQCAQGMQCGHDAMHGGRGMRGHPGMQGMEGMPGMGGPQRLMRLLDAAGASEAQRAQIRQIAAAAAADTQAQHQEMRSLRRQGMQLLAAPAIDNNAAEQVRQRMLALHDQTSARMLKAMIDAANVLTPDQRAKLAEQARQRAERMRQHHMMPRGASGAR